MYRLRWGTEARVGRGGEGGGGYLFVLGEDVALGPWNL